MTPISGESPRSHPYQDSRSAAPNSVGLLRLRAPARRQAWQFGGGGPNRRPEDAAIAPMRNATHTRLAPDTGKLCHD